MKYGILFFIICLQVNYSCSIERKSLADFDDVIEVEDYSLLFSDSTLSEIDCIMPWDNYIILSHNSDTCMYTMLNSDSGEILRRWGMKGHGRNESLSFSGRFHIQGSLLSYYDKRSKELCYVDLKRIAAMGDYELRKEHIPYSVDFRPSYIVKTDSFYCGVGHFKNGRLGCLDSHKQVVTPDIDYPFDTEGLDYLEKGMLYQGLLMYNKKQNKILLTTYCSDIFEIIKVDNNAQVSRLYVNMDGFAPVVMRTAGQVSVDTQKSVAGILNAFVDDNNIYMLHSLLSYDEAEDNDYKSNQILSFDWNGNKKVKYVLPIEIQSFYVCGHYIVGVTVNNGITEIYRFRINNARK